MTEVGQKRGKMVKNKVGIGTGYFEGPWILL